MADSIARHDIFATTRWSVVLTAGIRSDTTRARAALGELCETYWYPLYAYIRRRGYDAPTAEDLTQGFFARLLRAGSLARVRRERGRFRAFLLAALKHYLADERDRARALKRGGGKTVVSLDASVADTRYRREPADQGDTPDRAFDRQWALTLLERVLARLEAEFAASEKGPLFDTIRELLARNETERTYAEIAGDLGMTEAALKMAVHRMRRRYRQLLRTEIAETVSGPEDVEDEIRHLFAVLA